MALETLRDSFKIHGQNIGHINDRDCFININHRLNEISFKIQNGPIKEVGVNGCQVDDLLYIAKTIIFRLNKNYPCKENEEALEGINKAVDALAARKARREREGNEGYNRETPMKENEELNDSAMLADELPTAAPTG